MTEPQGTTELSSTGVFADLALARRLERAEASASARSMEARSRLWPERGAAWIEVEGAYAMFDGARSPLTQTFGLGMFDETTRAGMDAIERFFDERRAPALHEVSPLAQPAVFDLLADRGYAPFEFTSVMFRPIGEVKPERRPPSADEPPGPASLPGGDAVPTARVAGPDEVDRWTQTAGAGWSEFEEVAEFMRDIGRLSMATENVTCFLAELAGEAVATAVLSLHAGVALFAGASTVPGQRGKGAQQALLEARLRFAAGRGCDLGMICAAPGSASQRNAERHGFRIAYTRMKFRRSGAAATSAA